MKAKIGVTEDGIAGVELQPESEADAALVRVFVNQASAPGFRISGSTDHDRSGAITHLVLTPERVEPKATKIEPVVIGIGGHVARSGDAVDVSEQIAKALEDLAKKMGADLAPPPAPAKRSRKKKVAKRAPAKAKKATK